MSLGGGVGSYMSLGGGGGRILHEFGGGRILHEFGGRQDLSLDLHHTLIHCEAELADKGVFV